MTLNYKMISIGNYTQLYNILPGTWLPGMPSGEKLGLPAYDTHFSEVRASPSCDPETVTQASPSFLDIK